MKKDFEIITEKDEKGNVIRSKVKMLDGKQKKTQSDKNSN